MATLRKRGNRYQVQIRKKGLPQITRSFSSRELAQTYIKDTESKIEQGLYQDFRLAESTTLLELSDRYEKEILPLKKGFKKEIYNLQVIKRAFGAYSLSHLKPHVISNYRLKRLKHVSSGTVRREIGLLSRLLTAAEKEFGIYLPDGNPVRRVVMPKDNPSRERRATTDELGLLFKDKTVGTFVKVAVFTAMRRGEIASVEEKHLIGDNLLHIPDTKTGNQRDIPLNKVALGAVRELIEFKKKYPNLRPDSITRAFTRACKRYGVKDLRFHDLRHEATSRLFELGLNQMEVASITGHKDLRMLRKYTHIKPNYLLNRIDELTKNRI